MPNAARRTLERFQNSTPMRPQHSPYKCLAQTYGAKVQYSPNASTAPALDKCGITRMQSTDGTFLYISRAVNSTMLVTLNKIGAAQASPTTDTIQKTKMLMDYTAMQPDAVIRFHASNMCLHININAAYLVQPKAYSRAAGHFYLS